MIPFELVQPTSLAEAIELLDPDDATVRPIAGGTALMLMMKAGVFHPEKLVSLRKIEHKYSSIEASAERTSHRRNDGARRAGTVGRGKEACASDQPHAADLVQCARAQCRDRRRRRLPMAIRTWTCHRC